MSEFFLNTRFFKRQPSLESDIQEQLDTLKVIVKKIAVIDPIFSTWYINNPTGTKPPLDYPFPSEKADNYLLKLRKEDEFQSFSLWNAEDNSNFVSINFDTFDFRMNFEKVLTYEKIVELLKVLLDHVKFKYMYLNNNFFQKLMSTLIDLSRHLFVMWQKILRKIVFLIYIKKLKYVML
jgi:hypothetical protein